LSGHGRQVNKQGELTSWRLERNDLSGYGRWKERKQPSKGHSLSGVRRKGDSSGHRKKVNGQERSLSGDHTGRDLSGHGNDVTE